MFLCERFLHGKSTTVPATKRVLDEELMYVRLPRGYSAKRPAGLLIWINAGIDGHIPDVFFPALDELGMVGVGIRKVENERPVADRYQLAFDAFATASKRFHIDPRRVYLTGISGGGRISSILAACFPDYFTDDCLYKVVSRENHSEGLPQAAIFCDGIGMVHDRITGLRETQVYVPRMWRHFISGVRITAAPTDHRPVEPTLGYRIEHDGASVVIGGDGVPCAGLDQLCAGADVYVQTVLREDLVRAVPFQRFTDTIDYHSTVQQAAATAQRAGVKKLVFTHQVPAPAPGTEDEWTALAAETYTGEIVMGVDLTTVSTD